MSSVNPPAIRFVVFTWKAWHKTKGYHSRISQIISTVTGRYLFVRDVGGDNNVTGKVSAAVGGYECILDQLDTVSVTDLRELDAHIEKKIAPGAKTLDSHLTKELILALETKEDC